MLGGNTEQKINYISRQSGKIAFVCYAEEMEKASRELPNCSVFDLGEKEDEAEQAKRLFALLRDADELGFDHIYAPLPSTEGMGMALYNRMIRAASHDVVDLTAAEKK